MKVMKAKKCVPHLLVLPLLAVLLLTSCARHSAVWPQLLEAEKLLDADLPAAAALIDSVDTSPLRGEDAALYAILKTQADYKRDIRIPSDSLPRLATDYYGNPHRKSYRAAMAWYSLGCYYTEAKNDELGIESYLHAVSLFPDTLVRYYALSEQNLGTHYLVQDLYDNALHYFSLYKNHPYCQEDSLLICYADYFLGQTNQRMLRFSEAARCFHSVISNSSSPAKYRNYSLFQLAKNAYSEDHDLASSLGYLNLFTERMDGRTFGASLALKGRIFQDLQLPDSAYDCFLEATQLSDDDYTLCFSYQQLNTLSAELHRYDSLQVFFQHYVEMSQKLNDSFRQEEISRIENDHTVELYKRKVISYVRAAIALFLLLLLGAVLWMVIRKKRTLQRAVNFHADIQENQQRELELCVADNADSEEDPFPVADEEPAAQPAALNEALLTIRRQRMDFYRTHFQGTDSWKRLSSLDRIVLESPKSNEKLRLQIKEELMAVCSGFAWELSLESPSLTEVERLYCSCVMLGLKEEEILFVTDTTHRALITKKCRIRKKISPEWNHLLFS